MQPINIQLGATCIQKLGNRKKLLFDKLLPASSQHSMKSLFQNTETFACCVRACCETFNRPEVLEAKQPQRSCIRSEYTSHTIATVPHKGGYTSFPVSHRHCQTVVPRNILPECNPRGHRGIEEKWNSKVSQSCCSHERTGSTDRLPAGWVKKVKETPHNPTKQQALTAGQCVEDMIMNVV